MNAVLPTQGGSSGAWGTALNNWLTVAHNAGGTVAGVHAGVVNVMDDQFGGVGDGVANDTAAIQAAINFATGSAAPATHTRTGREVYLPPGIFKVTSDLIIQSVEGFKFTTAGLGQTIILASGTGFTQAVIFINGSADGIFEGIDLRGDGTEACGSGTLRDGIRLDWVQSTKNVANCVTNSTTLVTTTDARTYDVGATVTGPGIPVATTVVSVVPGVSWTLSNAATASATVTIAIASLNAASRSTTGNRFRDVRVRALKAKVLFSGEGNGGVQLDGTMMDNVIVTGAQTPGAWSTSGPYQIGFSFGDGIYANNYDHSMTRCDAALCYYGWKVNASSIDLDGSQPGGNFCDFNILTNGQSSIKNIQSQGSGQFLTSPASFPPSPTTVEDAEFLTFNPNAGYPVITLGGGVWNFTNFTVPFIYASSAYQTGIISVSGQNSSRPCIAVFDNLTMLGTKSAVFSISNSDVQIRNYHNYNPATGNTAALVAGDLLSYFSGGTWRNFGLPTPAALTPTFANGTASQLSDTTQDYMVYLQLGTPGTAFSLAIGPTSTPANTIMASATPLADELLSFLLPAGWYVKWAGTATTITTQTAIGR